LAAAIVVPHSVRVPSEARAIAFSDELGNPRGRDVLHHVPHTYTRALRADPQDADAYFGRGYYAYCKKADVDEASAAIDNRR
jgi:hypothetical protein